MFYEALHKDLNKSKAEALASEISPVLEECAYFLDVRKNNFMQNHHAKLLFPDLELRKFDQRQKGKGTYES